MSDRLLCFGGPLNERHIAAQGHVWLAPMSPRPATMLQEMSTTSEALELRTVTYRRERVGYHFDHLCQGDPFHDDRCRWTADCWVADGFPRERITDALNMLIRLADLAAGRRL